MNIEIDYLSYQKLIRVKKEEDQRLIFDVIRKRWLVLQPEELVRQMVLQYLLKEKNYKATHFSLESGFKIYEGQRFKRYDLLAFDLNTQPFLMIECKAPQISLDQKVFWQVSNYNTSYLAKYAMVTNGIRTYCWEVNWDNQEFKPLNEIPDYPLVKND